ncbi:hypothetical protein NIES2100_17370 [Calothrix sp. NIES-2100]|uniref:hypothetical protein n=1 Tax=Calothrix sp. NIES-2100 TaxID=1954172 RepID=UPI000B60BBD5|nr:hypothetical protein NIES2100_17370 [Calothrix sp. NIES-2100]
MKTKLKQNQTETQKHNSKVMELSNLTELSDQEAELVIGGSTSETLIDSITTLVQKIIGLVETCWGSGGTGGSGSGGGTGG